MLDPQTLQQLQSIWQQGEEHDQACVAHADKWLMITPDTGTFLYQLVRASGARRIVEIGTSSGYSTLWLALAAKANQGHITTLDKSEVRQQQALLRLGEFGVDHLVTLDCVDAAAWLAAFEASPVDFLFLDADRSGYSGLWHQIDRVLRPGGMVVMDNALSHPAECAPFIAQVNASDGYLAQTYPIGKGQFVILKDH